jgi:hypothetical protein
MLILMKKLKQLSAVMFQSTISNQQSEIDFAAGHDE